MVFKNIIFQNRYVALETPSRPPPPFMANTILNFHFDYLTTPLIVPAEFFKRSYLFWSFQEMEEATEVDVAATALLSDTPIQVSVSEN